MPVVSSQPIIKKAARPLLGVIRWDGDNVGTTGLSEAVMLGPSQFHYRLPWFGVEVNSSTVTKDGNTQPIRDAEIELCSSKGVDYWAFWAVPNDTDWPGQSGALGRGLNHGYARYLTSAQAYLIKHTFILGGWQAGTTSPVLAAGWDTFSDELVTRMTHPHWQNVLGNRPLLYWYLLSNFVTTHGSNAAALAAMNLLRTKCMNAGLGNPYMVSLDNTDVIATTLGMDAVSMYAVYGTATDVESPYSTLTANTAAKWAAQRAAGFKVVPIVMVGWDFTPRNGWGATYSYTEYANSPAQRFTACTPAQLKAHVQAALDFVAGDPHICQAGVLLYSYGETTEAGSVLQPTLGVGDELIQALGELRNA